MTTNELITAAELGTHLGVDGGTVRRWVRAGRLTPEFTTPGGHFRFNLMNSIQELTAHPED